MKISIYELKIPFIFAFSHNKASRKATQTIIVKVQDNTNIYGLGEGCPREYVTRETIDSAINFFNQYNKNFESLNTVEKIQQWMLENQMVIDANPAAWCAVECAILDFLSRKENKSIEAYLGLNVLTNQFSYSAVLGSEKIDYFKKTLMQYKKIGFSDYKLKVSGDLNLDIEKIRLIEGAGIKNIRLDGNNIWSDSNNAIEYIQALNYPFRAIEEPVGVQDFKSMTAIYEALEMPIILDESFLSVRDFALLSENHKGWIINLRVSKMGGILRSLSVAELAGKNNIKLIIGSQVGETSILTRAALTIVNENLGNVIAQEGAFGTYLLQKDISKHPIMFGRNGQLKTQNFSTRTGFGINYDETVEKSL